MNTNIRKMNSIELYKQGKVSLGMGAKIVKLTLSEYIDILKEYNVPINIDVDDAKKALQYARTGIHFKSKGNLKIIRQDLQDRQDTRQH
jgi:Uncharacterised protein family (UPF0175)